MADEEAAAPSPTAPQDTYPEKPEYVSNSDKDSDSDSDSEEETDVADFIRPKESDVDDEEDDSPEANLKRFSKVLDSKRYKRWQEDEVTPDDPEELFNFPPDPENWREEDLGEYWADAPYYSTKPGWDPNWVDEEDIMMVNREIAEGRDPPIAPFYVPYRKPYPVIPDNHYDIRTPKDVVEELDRIEEFLTWHSFVFEDGSTYEGTIWDDLAHGSGVYEAEMGLVRYEGEWMRNSPEGHGVLEVDLPTYEPVPGSKLEAKMRAEGHIFKRDFMSPEDREWLEKDIEDSIRFSGGQREIPFYENEEWVRQFGEKPEKGRYRYAGQWKHGRFHGCGVFELNERLSYGRFYFGEFMDELHGCDADITMMHSGFAEVAAAKARMFVNKPDGMVREERGPYGDPQHPYFYEEDDLWMAPGFINQFVEVPDYWKIYVEDLDKERQMWLDSFYKSPLRLPMAAEREYWWENENKTPEFVLVPREPEPDPRDPTKMTDPEDPLILHTPTGRVIDYVDDEEHGIRLFWKPPLEDGEIVDLTKVNFLPLGDFDAFYGRDTGEREKTFIERVIISVENKCKSFLEKLEKWTEKKKKEREMDLKEIETEIELAEAEADLKRVIKEMDDELKELEKEEEKKMKKGLKDDDYALDRDELINENDKISRDENEIEGEDEDDEEDDEDDESEPLSFGSVIEEKDSITNDQKGTKGGKSSPFAASSLRFASCGLASLVPSQLQHSFMAWKESKFQIKTSPPSSSPRSYGISTNQKTTRNFVKFSRVVDQGLTLRAVRQTSNMSNKHITKPHFRNNFKQKASANLERKTGGRNLWPHINPGEELNLFSLHIHI